VVGGSNGDDDDNDDEDDEAADDAHTHLHVLPPHGFPHPVGAASEALGRNSKVVGLILEGVEPLAAFRNLVDVVAHDAYGAVDFLWLCQHVVPNHYGF